MKAAFKVAIADLVLLGVLYLVVQDLQWRVSYANSEHLGPSYVRYPLTYVFGMVRSGFPLQSPLTFDWVQLLVALLIVVNAGFVYVSLAKGHPPATSP